MNYYVILQKARPYTRTRRGRFERVKGYPGKVKQIKMYHVAPERVRDSISKYGLDPTKAPYERSTEGTELYLFPNLESARSYRSYMSSNMVDDPEPFDIYEVRVNKKDLKADLTLRPLEEVDLSAEPESFFTEKPIAKKDLHRLK